MSGTPQTTPPATPPAHSDPERLSISPVPQKKTSIGSVFSWCADLFCKYPLLSAVTLYVTLTGVTAGVAYQYYNQDMLSVWDDIKYSGNGIVLVGDSFLLDITNQTLRVGWMIMGCGEYAMELPPWGDGLYCSDFNRAVDIYLGSISEPTFSYDPAKRSVSGDGFTVDHSLYTYGLDMAPFDTYHFTTTMFAIEKATNKSVPIVTFAASGRPKNFVVSSENSESLSNYTYDSGTGPTTVEVESGVTYITVKRSRLARAFTLCLLLINSALTAGSVYVTVLVLTTKEKINDGILFFPVTVVLTIPTLRSLYPGSHPFGLYIDTFGLFSQMMIVALCSIILLYAVAKPSRPDRRASSDSKNT